MPHDGAEPLFGSDKAQSGFKLYRRHRLLAETRQDIRRMTAALWEQAYHPCTIVRWGGAQVMAARSSRGQLLVQLRGRGRGYPVQAVTRESPRLCPTGGCDRRGATPLNVRDAAKIYGLH